MSAESEKFIKTINWSELEEQQPWFDKFKTPAQATEGIKFSQFRGFLDATLYKYFASLVKTEDVDCKYSYQQEMQIFSAFDANNDHLIDRDEFTNLCQTWFESTFRQAWALVIVDVQNDFIDGSLALINGPAGQDGAEVVPVINKLIDSGRFEAVAYTQDWHPRDHIGFYDNLHLRKHTLKEQQTTENHSTEVATKFQLKKLANKVKLFDTVLFDERRMEQKLWPIHCVQNSWGAELHPKLKIAPNSIRVYKGTLPHLDAYSAFWDNMNQNETGLRQELSSRKINDVFFCGVALDYCVAASALDSVKAGFLTLVIEDASRGLNLKDIDERKQEMIGAGVIMINSKSLFGGDLEELKLVKEICLKRVKLLST